MKKNKALYILNSNAFAMIYGLEEQREIDKLVDVYAPPQTKESIAKNPGLLDDVEVIFSGWGAPVMDEEFLAAAPRLKAVFYGAGSVKGFTTDAFWNRNIVLTSSYAANAVPVAEFTVAQMIFSLKRGWEHVFSGHDSKSYPQKQPVPGAYGSTIGIISLGMIGRIVCKMLQSYDVQVLAYDPFVSPEEIRELGAEPASLENVFVKSEVVSLHTPNLPETKGMINGKHISSMKKNSTFINTARGAVVNEPEMIEVLKKRPDIFALLDVTFPEPPEPGSPLYTLPNVVLTPHIAGSMDNECRRMGKYAIDECRRWLENKPLQWQITKEKSRTMA